MGGFSLGYQSAQNKNAAQRDRKQQLEDEERQFKFQDLYQQRNAIRENAAKLGLKPDDPQTLSQLSDIHQQMDQLYHPIHAPGALQRDWGFLSQLITRKKPQPQPLAPVTTTTTLALPVVPYQPTMPGATYNVGGPAGQSTTSTTPDISTMGDNIEPLLPGATYNVGIPAAETMAVPTAKVQGLVAAGNLPIWNRPAVKNSDGSISSEYSTSFTDENPDSPYYGKEVLAPTVVDGKFLTPDGKKPPEGSQEEHEMMKQARLHYEHTGQHLGVFDSPMHADKYSEALHSRGERTRPNAASYEPKLTSQDRQLKAQQERAQQAAKLFAQAGPLTPEQDAQAQTQAALAKINIVDKLPGLTDDQKQEIKANFLYTALGLPKAPKYMASPVQAMGPDGQLHDYRVPLDPTMPAEEIVFGEGQHAVPKTTGKVGLTFDKSTGQVEDRASGKRYNEGDPSNPPNIQAMFHGVHQTQADQRDYMMALTARRGSSYNDSKRVNVLDLDDGNSATVKSYADMEKEPGRYVPASEADRYLPRLNLLEDMRGNAEIVREDIEKMKASGGFPPMAKLAVAFADQHPRNAVEQLLQSSALGSLNEAQRQYVMATASLIEQAMGMRTILGSGQGSDAALAAIAATIPRLTSPDPSYALGQLKMFVASLDRVERGVPKNIKLNNEPRTPQGTPQEMKDTANQKTWPNAPPIGTVSNGRTYQGGDPRALKSWAATQPK